MVLNERPSAASSSCPPSGTRSLGSPVSAISLGSRGEAAHRSECRTRDEGPQERRERDRAERDEDKDRPQTVERPIGWLQALYDEHGPIGRETEWGDVFPEADRHRRLAGCVVRRRDVAIEAGMHVVRTSDGAHLRVVRDAKVEALRRSDEIAAEIDDLYEIAAVISRTADVTLELHRAGGAPQRAVELGLQLVTHDEIRRQRRERDDDGDNAGRDQREACAESHGSRST